MNERDTRHVRPGGQLSAGEFNRAMKRLDDLQDFSGVGIGSSDEFGQLILNSTLPARTHLRILSGSNPYAWEEVYLNEANDTWTTTGARSGTTTETPAIERNASASVAPGGVYEAVFDAGPDGAGRWLFNAGNMSLVRVTSTTTTGGRYPAKLAIYDAAGSSWTDGATIWVVDPNGNVLGLKRGHASRVGSVSGVDVYMGTADLWDDGTC